MAKKGRQKRGGKKGVAKKSWQKRGGKKEVAPEIQHTLRSDCSTRTGSTSQDAGAEILISDAMIEKISAPAVLRTFFDEEFQIVPFLLRTSYFRDERRKPKNLFFVKKGPCGLFSLTYFRIFRDLQDFFAFAPLKPQNSR